MKISQYFPNQKIRKQLLLKSFLGVLMGSFAFAGFSSIYISLSFITEQDYSFNHLVQTFLFVFLLTIWFSFALTIIPATLCGIALTFFIYRNFRKGEISRHKAVITGIKFVSLLGLLISLLFAFTFFRPEDTVSMLPFAIPVTLIASCVGAWGGSQVYKEILNFQEN